LTEKGKRKREKEVFEQCFLIQLNKIVGEFETNFDTLLSKNAESKFKFLQFSLMFLFFYRKLT